MPLRRNACTGPAVATIVESEHKAYVSVKAEALHDVKIVICPKDLRPTARKGFMGSD
jgi:hypothetical protein